MPKFDDEKSMHFFAVMSEVAYTKPSKRKEKLEEYGLGGEWAVVGGDDDYAVISPDDERNEPTVVTIRGTDLSSHGGRDMNANSFIALDKIEKSPRFVNLVKKISKINVKNLVFTGHSLGGALSTALGTSLQRPSVSFNMGSSPFGSATDTKKDSVHYTTNDTSRGQFDILSAWSSFFSDKDTHVKSVEQKQGTGAHSLSNFLPEKNMALDTSKMPPKEKKSDDAYDEVVKQLQEEQKMKLPSKRSIASRIRSIKKASKAAEAPKAGKVKKPKGRQPYTKTDRTNRQEDRSATKRSSESKMIDPSPEQATYVKETELRIDQAGGMAPVALNHEPVTCPPPDGFTKTNLELDFTSPRFNSHQTRLTAQGTPDLTSGAAEEASKFSTPDSKYDNSQYEEAPTTDEKHHEKTVPPGDTPHQQGQPQDDGTSGNRNAFYPGLGQNEMSGQQDGMRPRQPPRFQSEHPPPGRGQDQSTRRDSAGLQETQVHKKGGTQRDWMTGSVEESPWEGDQFMSNQNRDESEPTLRPQFGIAGAKDIIPSPRDQLRSDLEFDLFSVVQPGYGEGVDNKQFLYQKAWEQYIRFTPPFFSPGPYLGPLNTRFPMPWQWQTIMSKDDIDHYHTRIIDRRMKAEKAIQSHGEGSAAAFGRDVPEVPVSRSSSGLPRDARSPFEPIIHNKQPWTPAVDPAGYLLGRRGLKRTYSAWRDPDVVEHQRDNGGPTLRRRRALEVILP